MVICMFKNSRHVDIGSDQFDGQALAYSPTLRADTEADDEASTAKQWTVCLCASGTKAASADTTGYVTDGRKVSPCKLIWCALRTLPSWCIVYQSVDLGRYPIRSQGNRAVGRSRQGVCFLLSRCLTIPWTKLPLRNRWPHT